MTLEEYINKDNKKNKSKSKKIIYKLLITCLISFFVIFASRKNENFKTNIKKYLFETNFKFSKINKLYNKYLLNIKTDNAKPVSKNNINEWIEYKDGVIKDIQNGNSNINAIKSGIVVFIGEKEGYGNTLIVEQTDGVDAWYSNIAEPVVNLYSYVEENTALGTFNDKLYLSFWKNGEKIDYKNYIK